MADLLRIVTAFLVRLERVTRRELATPANIARGVLMCLAETPDAGYQLGEMSSSAAKELIRVRYGPTLIRFVRSVAGELGLADRPLAEVLDAALGAAFRLPRDLPVDRLGSEVPRDDVSLGGRQP